MERTVTAHLELDVTTPATLVLEIAVAQEHLDAGATESLTVTAAGDAVEPRELLASHGTRLHVVEAGAGPVSIDYRASLTRLAEPAEPTEADTIAFLRPSRYCESDSLAPTARSEFAGLSGAPLLAAVSSWVGTRLAYVPGASLPTDGAVRTLLARQGVCRDYAHLVVALLRALDVPARLVSVYAPGLTPMDFHAVAEAFVDGRWCVVDATTLAPRGSLVRIATGQDASSTAFLSVHHGTATMGAMEVTAVADVLPDDDLDRLVTLR
ncbi:transglutaminase-like domain-containing protein [Litorihabitans aurantiacus]|uniref:Transglutaminase-like protein n=1 Tax=Litorihabitans aurantiacus TaxID=1930061 RepID=A0AA38CWB0_9MICO|nr:transglutaminase family protein [Litorihabitans aurantiacus]GMA32907.1 putative transglutaminase-like protein [Litorihabitans aurantiacus]